MNRREYRARQNSVTRTYPVYAISSPEFSDDDDSVAEIRSVDRYGYRRRRPLTIHRSDRIIAPALTDYRRDPWFRRRPRRARKTVKVQTDDAVDRVLSPTGVGSRSWRKRTGRSKYRCLRICTFILAVFLLLISILLLIFSLNLLLNPNMTKIRSVALIYPQALPSSGFTGRGPTDTLLVTAIMGIALGALMLIISILSIIYLLCIRVRFHACFFCLGPGLHLLLFLIFIGLIIFVLVTGETELQRLAWSTQTTVFYFYNSTAVVRNGWDFVQYYFGCCGVKTNNTDWLLPPSTGWSYATVLPRSCCGYDPNDAGHGGRIFAGNDVPSLTGTCYYGDIRQPTCYDSIKANLLIAVWVFLIALTLIVLFLGVLSLIVLCLFRGIDQRLNYFSRK